MKYWSHIYVIGFVYTFPRSYHKVTIHFMNIFCESSITHSKYVKYRPIIVNCFSNWSSLTIVMPRPPFNSSLFMCYGEMDFNKITANFDCFFFFGRILIAKCYVFSPSCSVLKWKLCSSNCLSASMASIRSHRFAWGIRVHVFCAFFCIFFVKINLSILFLILVTRFFIFHF